MQYTHHASMTCLSTLHTYMLAAARPPLQSRTQPCWPRPRSLPSHTLPHNLLLLLFPPAGDHASFPRANQARCRNFCGSLTGPAPTLTEQSDRPSPPNHATNSKVAPTATNKIALPASHDTGLVLIPTLVIRSFACQVLPSPALESFAACPFLMACRHSYRTSNHLEPINS